MQKSKLERCLDILELLARQGPSGLRQVAREIDVNLSTTKRDLGFLIQQNLVEKQTSKDRVSYTVTERGLKVLNVAIPIVEEAQKISLMLHAHAPNRT